MVLEHYNLAEQPFGVTPDPRYLYFSATHREALASLLYSVSAGRGFATLIARPGMGKTTLLFDFLKMAQHSAKTVFLCQSQYSPRDFLRSLLADLEIEDDGTDLLRMHKKLNDCLLVEAKAGRQLVVVIDEAQNLKPPVLEVVRMLSNFETPQKKMMHLVLAGQPQLAETLSSSSMVQLRQRISIVARLKPFALGEAQTYIDHRLRVAGYSQTDSLFTKQAVQMIAAHSEGIPRNINNICFNAMALGCVLKQKSIGAEVIQEVLADLDLRSLCPVVEAVPTAVSPVKTADPLPVAAPPKDHRPNNSMFLGWSRRSALAVALVGVVAWPVLRLSHGKPNLAAVEAKGVTEPRATIQSVVQEPITSAPIATPAANISPTIVPDTHTITVQPNDTVYSICMENFGEYNFAILEQLLEANPDLGNPSRIRPGQKLQITLNANLLSSNSSQTIVSPTRTREERKQP